MTVSELISPVSLLTYLTELFAFVRRQLNLIIKAIINIKLLPERFRTIRHGIGNQAFCTLQKSEAGKL